MDHQRHSEPAFSAPRRVFTAPTYVAPPLEQTSSTTAGGLVETLYNHPSVKIVAFTAGPRPVFSRGKGIAPPVEIEPGSLPWSSQLERTIAVGSFRIYRAQGSVAFLSCGSALQPILPKSQCWCVDEVSSKYVLQIRRPQYWRIEVPVAEPDERRRAWELREVLDKVLQFEKTECPFRRTFTVELPERPQTPVKKRPWTPVRRSSAALPPSPITPVDMTPVRRVHEEAAPVENGLLANELDTPLSAEFGTDSESHRSGLLEEEHADEIEESGKVDAAVSALEQIVQGRKEKERAEESSSLAKPTGSQSNRSVTAPPQLTVVTATLPTAESNEVVTQAVSHVETVLERTESHSPTGSQDSFHSVQSWTSPVAPLPPSPPLTATSSPKDSAQYLFVAKKDHPQDVSDLTATPNTPMTLSAESSGVTESQAEEPASHRISVHDEEVSSTSTVPTTEDSLHSPTSPPQPDLSSVPTASDTTVTYTASATVGRSTSNSSSSSTVLTRRRYMRHRPTASSSISPNRGALPRLTSAADLFPSYRTASHSSSGSKMRPPPPSRLSLVRRLPMAVIHKTCELLFSPPAHLIALMLKVAARIAAGEWRGYVFGFDEGGERIPVRWDWSDEDDDGEGELGGWGADEDWEFARTRRGSGFRMAGAYPESPEQAEDKQLDATPDTDDTDDDDERPNSPSLSRKTRSLSQGRHSNGDFKREIDSEQEDDAATADWTGNLSID